MCGGSAAALRALTPAVRTSAQWDVVLGRGAFKTVYKGFDEEEGIEVAWNRVRVSELVQSKEERDRLFAEIRVLKQLKHKNIMTFYDSWLDSKCAAGPRRRRPSPLRALFTAAARRARS